MHPRTNRRRLWARVAGAALTLAAASAACGGVTGKEQRGTDGVTHWLNTCALDSECGGLDCLCGVCTRQCTENDGCGDLGADAVCTTVRGGTCEALGPERVCTRAGIDAGVPPKDPDAAGSGGAPAGSGGAPPPDAGTGTGGAPTAPDCAPMDARWNSTECLSELGFTFTGDGCELILCGCTGTECDRLYPTLAACEAARLECILPGSTTCASHGECALDRAPCCVCGSPGPDSVVALREDRVPEHVEHECGGPGCPLLCIQNPPVPTLYPVCDAGACAVRDVTPFAACMTDDDCSVQFKDCCACGADASPSGVVAVNDIAGYREFVCGPDATCPECVGPPLPESVAARCQAGTCVLDVTP